MTDKTKLREALGIVPREIHAYEAGQFVHDTEAKAVELCIEAAQTLLDLIENHDIQALIDGRAEITAKSAVFTKEQLTEFDKQLNINQDLLNKISARKAETQA